jgi:RNAse (barnase) inhibitor barstar
MLRIEDLKSTDAPAIHFVRASEIAGLLALELNGRDIVDRDHLLAELGRVLEFPAYYGGNWDAFEECLHARAERDREGCVLVIRDAACLWAQMPRDLGMLISIWLAAAERLKAAHTALHLIFVLEPAA